MLSAEQEPAELGTGLKVDPLSFPTSLSPTSLAGGGRVPVSPVFPFILGVPAGRAEPLLERWSATFALKHWGKPTSLRNKVRFGSSPLLFLHRTQLRVTPQWHLGSIAIRLFMGTLPSRLGFGEVLPQQPPTRAIRRVGQRGRASARAQQ